MKTPFLKFRILRISLVLAGLLSVIVGTKDLISPPEANASIRILSRANCALVRNESLTWDATLAPHWFWTNTYHYQNGVYMHGYATNWQYTWDAVIGDFDLGLYSWSVLGYHWTWINGVTIFYGSTYATGCFDYSFGTIVG